ncbi:DNA-directed RNA polymerase subunit beta [Paenibacillus sp. 1P03SA]|uniref:DNA-directed RNA polymerase subunit beta n=1 Tax=Paenibacillus sp. 1P03SA TaxID=3132294 RepID=UPI0039A13503
MEEESKETEASSSTQAKEPDAVKPEKTSGSAGTLRVLKKLRVPLIFLGALIIGLWIGYSGIGGQPTLDIFRISTWKHLFDLVFAD